MAEGTRAMTYPRARLVHEQVNPLGNFLMMYHKNIDNISNLSLAVGVAIIPLSSVDGTIWPYARPHG